MFTDTLYTQGFLSLACANRSCPPGRRFGEDYYDERMKAAWRVDVSTADPCKSVYESCTPHRLAVVREKSGDDGTDGASQSQDMSHSLESTVDGCKITPKSDLRFTTANPLHWFGVLVPAALRNAQTSFVSAVDGPIPALANVIIEMREVEQNVHNLRKTLLAAEILDGLEL